MKASQREKTLLGILVGALLIGGGIIGGSRISSHLQARTELLRQKQAQVADSREWLNERAKWEERGQWLEAHRPPPYEGQQTEAAFVQEVQASLSHQGVEILEQRMQESVQGRKIIEVGIDLVLHGSLEQFVRWMHDIRKTDAYRSVEHVRIKSDVQDSRIRAEVTLVRYFERQ